MPLRLTVDDQYDAAIIGAGPPGPGGDALPGGKRVVVVERRRSRVKVCGSSSVRRRRLAGASAHAGATAGRMRSVHELIIEFGERRATWAMPEPAWVLSRATLTRCCSMSAGRGGGASAGDRAMCRTTRITRA